MTEKRWFVGVIILSFIVIGLGLRDLSTVPRTLDDIRSYPETVSRDLFAITESFKEEVMDSLPDEKRQDFLEFIDSPQAEKMVEEKNALRVKILRTSLFLDIGRNIMWFCAVIFGIGMLMLKRWGRKGMAVLAVLAILLSLLHVYFMLWVGGVHYFDIVFRHDFARFVFADDLDFGKVRMVMAVTCGFWALGKVVPLSITLFFLTRPKVKALFSRVGSE